MSKIYLVFILGFSCFSLISQELHTNQLQPIEYQIGTWVAKDVKMDKNGRRLQFGYELQWFDLNQSIAKMVITTIYEDGEILTIWEGFKRWDAKENKIIYNGYSRNGRVAEGYIKKESESVLKTYYTGNMQDGTKVFIEDVATFLDPLHFDSVTNLRINGEQEWKVLNTDHWVKVENQVFDEMLK